MSSLHCLVHPLPGTEDQLNERLKELGVRLNLNGSQGIPAVRDLNCNIREVVIGPSHIGILTEDGRVARLVFSVNTENLDLNKTEQTKGRSSTKSSNQSSTKLTARMSTGGRRIMRTSSSGIRGTRGAGVIMGAPSAPPLIPSHVPEELISQAQVVLQGKSRNLIIRELQRANLDVNLAVNNLLSRDDEEGDDAEESSESYAPDDLISLLDANISVATDHPSVIIDADGMFPDDMFAYSSRSRSSSARNRASDRESRDSPPATGTENTGRGERTELRWRERHYSGSSPCKKKDSTSDSVDVADGIQWWPDNRSSLGGNNPPKFIHIAAMHSELIAVSVQGQLHQWRWSDREPFLHPDGGNIYHPKSAQLSLISEKVVAISAAVVRCSVATESGKVATWFDETLNDVTAKLEQPAILYPEFQQDHVSSLLTCHLYTCAWTESGAVYWWGVLPFCRRKKLWDKFRSKSRKHRAEITEGAQVGLRISPMYSAGALAFCMSGGVPKMGQLLSSAWCLSDTSRFKILPAGGLSSPCTTLSIPSLPGTAIPCLLGSSSGEKPRSAEPPTSKLKTDTSYKDSWDKLDMPPPPSPASSTCSDTGSISSTTYKRGKRVLPKDDAERYDEEEWLLKDVVFVEDTKTAPIGEVLAVDGEQVVVVPLAKESKNNLRVFARDKLIMVRSAGGPKVPDCYQKSPKKIPIADNGEILTLAVDEKGIHAVVKIGAKINYTVFNLNSGKIIQENSLPTDSSAFLGLDAGYVSLNVTGENGNVVILQDGNGTIYPLSKDCTDSIKDPKWPDLPPVSAINISTHFLHSAAPHQKNHVALIVLALKKQILLPKILKCDLEGVKAILTHLDSNISDISLKEIASEKCDGNRNIIHACVSACFPVSSKDPETDSIFDKESLFGTFSWPPETSENILLTSSSVGAAVEEGLLNPSSSKNLAGPSMPSLGPGEKAMDPNERRSCLLLILKGICEARVFKPYLREFLMAKDSNGFTPFMLAVTGRAYQAALILLNVITNIARENSLDNDSEKRAMAQMVFPKGSNPDDSPLHVLCYNDTCSFTWTGDLHINQDIFECKTCGLTGSLCCCTECARVCHKGHDCKLKHTSPTAYCDCWQKCKCKALKAGHQSSRFELLSRLILDTDLVNHPNGRGESILLFLLQTVRRQIKEQRQFPRFRGSLSSRKNTVSDSDLEMPEHDLEPPKFSRKALERLLKDWYAIKAMIMTGYKGDAGYPSGGLAISDGVNFMQYQGHTTRLDKFTYCLLVKLYIPNHEDRNLKNKHVSSTEDDDRKQVADNMVSTLINTITRELHNTLVSGRRQEAIKVARRFVASAVRIFTVLGVEMSPTQTKKKSSSSLTQPLAKCIKVFESLLPMAICELCEAAESLILPVRLNFVKPTAPFPLTNIQLEGSVGCQEMFEVDPLQRPRQVTSTSSETVSISTSRNTQRQIAEGILAGISSRLDRTSFRTRESAAPSNVEDIENEGPQERESDRSNADRAEADREDGADGESDMELDLLAESDSDSDDNQSGVDNASAAQRSTQTGATAGSDREDDSGDTSQGEDEDDQSGAATETDEIELNADNLFADEQLERRANATLSSRNLTVTHPLQWAIRTNRDSGSRSATIGLSGATGTSNLTSSNIYIDAGSLRRGAGVSSAVSPAHEPVSVATTNNTLARAFSIIMRQMTHLLNIACEAVAKDCSSSRTSSLCWQNLTPPLIVSLLNHIDGKLQPTWDWLLSLMDSTEAQLRFGRELNQIIEGEGGSASPTLTAPALSIPSTLNLPVYNLNNFSTSGTNTVNNLTTSSQLTSSLRSSRDRIATSSGASTLANAASATAGGASSSQRTASLQLIRDPLLSRCQTNRRNSRVTATSSENQVARRDTLAYIVSILRAHKNEHCDSLPDLDICSLKHIAYVFDALMSYLKCCEVSSQLDSSNSNINAGSVDSQYFSLVDHDENSNEDDLYEMSTICPPLGAEESALLEDSNSANTSLQNRGRKHPFFQRSNSTLCLGSMSGDVFSTSLQEALPLADRPQLLQPNARKEELFGLPRTHSHNTSDLPGAPLEKPLSRLGVNENQQVSGSLSTQTKDSFYETLFNTTDYLQQQPTDLSTSSGFSLGRDYKSDSYTYDRERIPIIVSPRRSPQAPSVGSAPPAYPVDYTSEASTSSRLGAKSVIVRVGSSPSSVLPPPPYSVSANPISSPGIYSKNELSVPNKTLPGTEVLVVPLDGRKCSQSSDVLQPSHEVSANVTVDNTHERMKPLLLRNGVTQDLLLGRWRLALELFGRVFIDDVGAEPGSFIPQLGGFSFKELRFRREMEKLRNQSQRDLNITKLVRERGELISQTFKELNSQYNSNHHRRPSQSIPCLAVNRVKITFKDEPGEGTGVARSFYTAVAEAILSQEKLPSLESCQVGLSVVRCSLYGQFKGRDSSSSLFSRSLRRESRKRLSADARPFYPHGENNEHLTRNLQRIGETIFNKVQILRPPLAGKITGMLLELTQPQLLVLSTSEEALKQKVNEAVDLILGEGGRENTDYFPSREAEDPLENHEESIAPLFYQPGKRGYYSPRQGKSNPERLNAFRNVGRLLGICLLQNELCPIYLNRHVLKYILGRPIKFHDLAFFDPTTYESLRKLVVDAENKDSGSVILQDLDLNFTIDLIAEEGGCTLDLVPGGRAVDVNTNNVYDYVRKYAEFRMVKSQERALQNLRSGVFDVLPSTAFDSLTSEDLRLLLNGVGDINVSTLINYTSFNDESTESTERLQKFKRWLWSIVEKMTVEEKQDLVYFWTGSPALPASEEGFQPMPTVTIRPADDSHLPTANTCISRLYIPLYSTKAILRSKLLLAIKTKNFGFV